MAPVGAEGGVERTEWAEVRGDVRIVGRVRVAQRVTPRPLRSWGLMGKVLAGFGGSCGACGTAAAARETARTGQPGSGEAVGGRQKEAASPG